MDAEKCVERPEVQLGILIDEAWPDPGAVVGWRDQVDLERLPTRCARDTKCTGREAPWDVKEDAAGGSTSFVEGVTESRDRDGE
jgi:hypothetical protein